MRWCGRNRGYWLEFKVACRRTTLPLGTRLWSYSRHVQPARGRQY